MKAANIGRSLERLAWAKEGVIVDGNATDETLVIVNRSILSNPRRADMKDILNLKIKRRASFRPFAPSVLREAVPEWFEAHEDMPFMMQVFKIREAKREEIPAVTPRRRHRPAVDRHLGGQSAPCPADSVVPRYHRRAEEAIDCFLRTKMDVLVLGDTLIRR